VEILILTTLFVIILFAGMGHKK